MGMLTTPQGADFVVHRLRQGRPRRNDQHGQSRFYTKEVPQRRARGGHRPRAGRVARHGLQVREDGGPLTGATQGEEEEALEDGQVGAARGPVAHRRLQGEQEAEAHGAPGLAPARRRVRRRRLRADRQALREGGEASPRGRPGLLPRPRLARGGRAGRLRPRGVRREGHEARDALLRRELPLLQRGARPGVPRRERGVRVPGPQERLRVRRRRPHQGRLRQRDRGRPPRVRQGPHHQALRGLQRPLRVRVPVLQPLLRTREGVRGEQGRDAEEEPLRPGPAGVGRRRVQRETAGEVARHVAQGALQEGAAELELFEDDLAAMLALRLARSSASSTGGRAPTRRARSASTAGTGTRRRPSAPGGRWSSGSGRRGSR